MAREETGAESDRTGELPHPRERASLSGHETAEAQLLEAFRAKRLAHAQLICGPKGVGKATLAYRIARLVLAYGMDPGLARLAPGQPADPSDAMFRQVATQSHPDLLILRRVENDKGVMQKVITVDQVRRLIEFMTLTSSRGGWRVAIIDPADDMNNAAANALLKILEEPPPRCLILLISHQPGQLIPTIRSRCRRLVLKPLSPNQVRSVTAELRPDLGEDDLEALARLAEGSPGRALALAEAGGLDLYREISGLLAGLPRLDLAAVMALADRLTRKGAEDHFAVATDLFRQWLARLVRIGATGAETDEVLPGEGQRMLALAIRRPLDHWVQLFDGLTRLFERTEAVNLDRRQVLIDAFLQVQATTQG